MVRVQGLEGSHLHSALAFCRYLKWTVMEMHVVFAGEALTFLGLAKRKGQWEICSIPSFIHKDRLLKFRIVFR